MSACHPLQAAVMTLSCDDSHMPTCFHLPHVGQIKFQKHVTTHFTAENCGRAGGETPGFCCQQQCVVVWTPPFSPWYPNIVVVVVQQCSR